jgi:hypothetical protein
MANELLKEFIINTMTGQISGIMKQLKNNPEILNNSQKYSETISLILVNSLLNYYNKCYHGYFQKNDQYIVEKINAIIEKGKHPICIFNILFRITMKWLTFLQPNFTTLYNYRNKNKFSCIFVFNNCI